MDHVSAKILQLREPGYRKQDLYKEYSDYYYKYLNRKEFEEHKDNNDGEDKYEED